MLKGTNGHPNPNNIVTFEANAGTPVDLEVGPNNDLFYADLTGGNIHRITYSSSTTQLGLTSVGSNLDDGDANNMNGSRIVVGAQNEAVSSISSYIGPTGPAPNN